jgi:hypothetical protein
MVKNTAACALAAAFGISVLRLPARQSPGRHCLSAIYLQFICNLPAIYLQFTCNLSAIYLLFICYLFAI